MVPFSLLNYYTETALFLNEDLTYRVSTLLQYKKTRRVVFVLKEKNIKNVAYSC